MKYIDLTHTFTADMPVYPGDPKSTLEQVAQIENGKKMDEISPERFFGKGVLIDVRGKMNIDESVLEGIEIEKGSVVLLFTGFGSKYRTSDYFKDYPELKEDFATRM